MNLRDLEYLVALDEHRHFGKAAKACHVSQPALSMQLQKLESTLGVQLLERSNKSVMMTPVGTEIVTRARRLLSDAAELKEVARASQNPFTGTLTLGAFPTLAPYLLPQIVPHITAEHPALQLLLVEEKTDTLIAQLENGQLDAALLALPIDAPALEHATLFDDPFFLAVSPQHPLASKPHITQDTLNQEPLLLLEEGHCLRDQALEVCALASAPKQQDFRATSMETLRQMVAANVGITLMPRTAQREGDGIVYLPFSSAPPSRRIALFWRKSSARKAAYLELAERIAEWLSN